jgi:2-haloacid dehalogenase
MKIIAFDLHEVLFYMDYKKVLSIIWHTSPKLPLLRMPFYPQFWINFFKLVRKEAVGEEFVMRMAQWHEPLKPYINTGLSIINAQKPDLHMVEIIKKCRNKGYGIIAFSNIGEHAYADLCTKFPTIMGLFDHAITTTKQDDYIRKPMNNAFEKLFRITQENPEEILFIDNTYQNIKAAQKLGIPSIHYQSPKQLYNQMSYYISI